MNLTQEELSLRRRGRGLERLRELAWSKADKRGENIMGEWRVFLFQPMFMN